MSAITLVPDDLFGDILNLACNESIGEKFIVAQVSKRLRSVALSTPLLWSSFRLNTAVDCLRLPTVLQRAGASTLLDIRVDIEPVSASMSGIVMQLLVPFAARIRTFDLELGRRQTLAPLFTGELDFPVLETLRLRALDQPRISFASAPELRVLYLWGVSTTQFAAGKSLPSPELSSSSPHAAFSTILSQASRLTMLQITWSDWVPSHLPYIFVLCPQLVRLVFHTVEPHDKEGIRFAVDSMDQPTASALRSLDLQLPLEDILEVLAVRVSQALSEVVVATNHLPTMNNLVRLMDALLQGVGPIVTFDWYDSRDIVLHDAAGRTRTMTSWGRYQRFDISEIWRCLASRHSAHTSVQRIHIPRPGDHWAGLASALAEYPLQTQQPTTVCIFMRWDDVRLLPHRIDLPSIAVPALHRVEFAKFSHSDTDIGFTKEAVAYFLRRISSQIDNTTAVDVVLGAPCVVQDAWHAQFLAGPDLVSAQHSMRVHLEKEVPGKWRLSFE